MNNQECKIKPKIINVNGKKPLFYPYSVEVNKCSDSCCNNINDLNAKLCVSDVGKDMNIKVFNLKLRSNETRLIEWHETCNLKYRLDTSVCINKD